MDNNPVGWKTVTRKRDAKNTENKKSHAAVTARNEVKPPPAPNSVPSSGNKDQNTKKIEEKKSYSTVVRHQPPKPHSSDPQGRKNDHMKTTRKDKKPHDAVVRKENGDTLRPSPTAVNTHPPPNKNTANNLPPDNDVANALIMLSQAYQEQIKSTEFAKISGAKVSEKELKKNNLKTAHTGYTEVYENRDPSLWSITCSFQPKNEKEANDSGLFTQENSDKIEEFETKLHKVLESFVPTTEEIERESTPIIDGEKKLIHVQYTVKMDLPIRSMLNKATIQSIFSNNRLDDCIQEARFGFNTRSFEMSPIDASTSESAKKSKADPKAGAAAGASEDKDRGMDKNVGEKTEEHGFVTLLQSRFEEGSWAFKNIPFELRVKMQSLTRADKIAEDFKTWNTDLLPLKSSFTGPSEDGTAKTKRQERIVLPNERLPAHQEQAMKEHRIVCLVNAKYILQQLLHIDPTQTRYLIEMLLNGNIPVTDIHMFQGEKGEKYDYETFVEDFTHSHEVFTSSTKRGKSDELETIYSYNDGHILKVIKKCIQTPLDKNHLEKTLKMLKLKSTVTLDSNKSVREIQFIDVNVLEDKAPMTFSREMSRNERLWRTSLPVEMKRLCKSVKKMINEESEESEDGSFNEDEAETAKNIFEFIHQGEVIRRNLANIFSILGARLYNMQSKASLSLTSHTIAFYPVGFTYTEDPEGRLILDNSQVKTPSRLMHYTVTSLPSLAQSIKLGRYILVKRREWKDGKDREGKDITPIKKRSTDRTQNSRQSKNVPKNTSAAFQQFGSNFNNTTDDTSRVQWVDQHSYKELKTGLEKTKKRLENLKTNIRAVASTLEVKEEYYLNNKEFLENYKKYIAAIKLSEHINGLQHSLDIDDGPLEKNEKRENKLRDVIRTILQDNEITKETHLRFKKQLKDILYKAKEVKLDIQTEKEPIKTIKPNTEEEPIKTIEPHTEEQLIETIKQDFKGNTDETEKIASNYVKLLKEFIIRTDWEKLFEKTIEKETLTLKTLLNINRKSKHTPKIRDINEWKNLTIPDTVDMNRLNRVEQEIKSLKESLEPYNNEFEEQNNAKKEFERKMLLLDNFVLRFPLATRTNDKNKESASKAENMIISTPETHVDVDVVSTMLSVMLLCKVKFDAPFWYMKYLAKQLIFLHAIWGTLKFQKEVAHVMKVLTSAADELHNEYLKAEKKILEQHTRENWYFGFDTVYEIAQYDNWDVENLVRQNAIRTENVSKFELLPLYNMMSVLCSENVMRAHVFAKIIKTRIPASQEKTLENPFFDVHIQGVEDRSEQDATERDAARIEKILSIYKQRCINRHQTLFLLLFGSNKTFAQEQRDVDGIIEEISSNVTQGAHLEKEVKKAAMRETILSNPLDAVMREISLLSTTVEHTIDKWERYLLNRVLLHIRNQFFSIHGRNEMNRTDKEKLVKHAVIIFLLTFKISTHSVIFNEVVNSMTVENQRTMRRYLEFINNNDGSNSNNDKESEISIFETAWIPFECFDQSFGNFSDLEIVSHRIQAFDRYSRESIESRLKRHFLFFENQTSKPNKRGTPMQEIKDDFFYSLAMLIAPSMEKKYIRKSDNVQIVKGTKKDTSNIATGCTPLFRVTDEIMNAVQQASPRYTVHPDVAKIYF